jgi:hypothetical protein
MLRADDVVAQLRRLGTKSARRRCLPSRRRISCAQQGARPLGGYRFMFADDVRMERVLRKDLTYAAAAHPACSCRAPGTRPAWTMRAAAAQARYPVVLKWADPNAMIPLLRQAGMRSRRRSTATMRRR